MTTPTEIEAGQIIDLSSRAGLLALVAYLRLVVCWPTSDECQIPAASRDSVTRAAAIVDERLDDWCLVAASHDTATPVCVQGRVCLEIGVNERSLDEVWPDFHPGAPGLWLFVGKCRGWAEQSYEGDFDGGFEWTGTYRPATPADLHLLGHPQWFYEGFESFSSDEVRDALEAMHADNCPARDRINAVVDAVDTVSLEDSAASAEGWICACTQFAAHAAGKSV